MASPTGLMRDLSGQGNARARPNGQPAPAPVSIPPMVRPKLTVGSKAVLDSVAALPRHHLGDVLYSLKLKAGQSHPSSRSARYSRFHYRTDPVPLPLDMILGKENCTLTVKVAKLYLTPGPREEITRRRAVWGTDVYTDDSDIIAACIHGGWVRGEWGDDVDVSLLDLDVGIGAEPDVKSRSARSKKEAAVPFAPAPSPEVLTAPPKTGPVPVPAGKDLHVTVLVLPRLQEYGTTTRFGLRSREWPLMEPDGPPGGPHAGLSFMITGIRWVTNGAEASSRVRGKDRRERIRQALQEVQRSRSTELNTQPPGNAGRRAGDKAPAVDSGAKKAVAGNGDGDKENRPLHPTPAPDEDIDPAPATPAAEVQSDEPAREEPAREEKEEGVVENDTGTAEANTEEAAVLTIETTIETETAVAGTEDT
jgi:histone deacetylation protein Rxt3